MKHLPADSALARQLNHGWSAELELAATSVEIQHEHLRAYLSAHGVKRRALPKPLRIPRPGHEPEPVPVQRSDRRAATTDEALAIIAAGHKGMGGRRMVGV